MSSLVAYVHDSMWQQGIS